MAIRRFIEVFSRRKWVVILVFAGTVAVVGVGSHMMTPVYSASAVVRIAQTQESTQNLYGALSYADRLMNTYVHLLKTRTFLEETIRRLELEVAASDLTKMVKVEPLANAELLRITARDPDPWLSAAVANTLGLLLMEEGQRVYFGPGRSRQEILQEQLAAVERNLEEQRAQVQALLAGGEGQAQAGRIKDLLTRIEIQEKYYAVLLDEYDSGRVREAILANTITVVEWAIAPHDPSSPRMTLNLLLGSLVGLAGGAGLAFLSEYLDPRIHSTVSLRAATSLAVLGSVPRVPISKGTQGESVPLSGDSPSPAGEAFRTLRTILLSGAIGTCPRTLLIASAERGAGKSMVVVNLATVMAQAGCKVAVVDSDLRRPCLHRAFGVANKVGLSNVIADPGAASAALQQTRVPGVRVLTSGPLPDHPGELLGSLAMRELVRRLSSGADVVLFDSSPMLAVADAVGLASMVEGVLLVAARGEVTDRQLRTVLRRLDKVGARMLGVVLNKAKLDDESYGHYHDRATRNPAKSAAPGHLEEASGGRSWLETDIHTVQETQWSALVERVCRNVGGPGSRSTEQEIDVYDHGK